MPAPASLRLALSRLIVPSDLQSTIDPVAARSVGTFTSAFKFDRSVFRSYRVVGACRPNTKETSLGHRPAAIGSASRRRADTLIADRAHAYWTGRLMHSVSSGTNRGLVRGARILTSVFIVICLQTIAFVFTGGGGAKIFFGGLRCTCLCFIRYVPIRTTFLGWSLYSGDISNRKHVFIIGELISHNNTRSMSL